MTVERQYGGTRLGRQELEGQLLTDSPGALWNREMLERARVRFVDLPEMRRIVVAIDPAVTSGEEADETGIVVAGLGQDGNGYVLEDRSGRYTPTQWAREAVAAYHKHRADRIIAETNRRRAGRKHRPRHRSERLLQVRSCLARENRARGTRERPL
ncbi:phage terminase large subunit-like protein [Rhodoblastus sphagnicola]|uniref:hypothetical protein n=1 Tax=Rhodoblastus sphagnicola TaxID=333368 RepID=UPI001824A85C|nr:hypothetical protein [Rhodoblastus sphagnicola]MBB4196410.1 phage terminase large subunit-like protein [Rhodoblastus sphagnicola]